LDLGENNNNKPKNVVGVEGGRNRRVLQDIGNLVINQADPAANANVPKRITRCSFYNFVEIKL
jgi:hypothetical protein